MVVAHVTFEMTPEQWRAQYPETAAALSTEAMALDIAYRNLVRLGWRFSPSEIGKMARVILDEMEKKP